jgi:uncharacterized protein (DUF433 family)
MTLTPVKETHVYLDEKGDAWIKRAGVKVRQVVESLQQLDYRPEEVVRHFPYLTLSEVTAALTYYYDHRDEMDATIKRLREFAEKMQAETPEHPATKRIREARKAR